ncbi:hypothetical protein B0H11DRAFT_2189535 [Mycena galericulata]|nr:hypothetical protein B0H11DRAFT_2189535 [Mycena galericulata]
MKPKWEMKDESIVSKVGQQEEINEIARGSQCRLLPSPSRVPRSFNYATGRAPIELEIGFGKPIDAGTDSPAADALLLARRHSTRRRHMPSPYSIHKSAPDALLPRPGHTRAFEHCARRPLSKVLRYDLDGAFGAGAGGLGYSSLEYSTLLEYACARVHDGIGIGIGSRDLEDIRVAHRGRGGRRCGCEFREICGKRGRAEIDAARHPMHGNIVPQQSLLLSLPSRIGSYRMCTPLVVRRYRAARVGRAQTGRRGHVTAAGWGRKSHEPPIDVQRKGAQDGPVANGLERFHARLARVECTALATCATFRIATWVQPTRPDTDTPYIPNLVVSALRESRSKHTRSGRWNGTETGNPDPTSREQGAMEIDIVGNWGGHCLAPSGEGSGKGHLHQLYGPHSARKKPWLESNVVRDIISTRAWCMEKIPRLRFLSLPVILPSGFETRSFPFSTRPRRFLKAVNLKSTRLDDGQFNHTVSHSPFTRECYMGEQDPAEQGVHLQDSHNINYDSRMRTVAVRFGHG